jgi:hypothetical protein
MFDEYLTYVKIFERKGFKIRKKFSRLNISRGEEEINIQFRDFEEMILFLKTHSSSLF